MRQPFMGFSPAAPYFTIGAHPEMVDFVSRQGPSEFPSAGIVSYPEECK
jgi:hypothetical protein